MYNDCNIHFTDTDGLFKHNSNTTLILAISFLNIRNLPKEENANRMQNKNGKNTERF